MQKSYLKMSNGLVFLMIPFLFTSCLRNLNQTEYFRKLEILYPAQYELLTTNQSKVEEQIKEAVINHFSDEEVTNIEHWGAKTYYCGEVIRTKVVVYPELTPSDDPYTMGSYRVGSSWEEYVDGGSKVLMDKGTYSSNGKKKYYALFFRVSEDGSIKVFHIV